MQTQERDTETQPVYSPEELTQASIDLLRAVEASAALQDQLTTRVLQIERYLEESKPSIVPIAPTGPQLGYRDAQESFIAALAAVQAQAEPRDLRVVEALADMVQAAMRQADRAYYDLQEHNASPVSARHAATHDVAGDTGVKSTIDEPKTRVRIAHVHTLKEGWRCNETTVEYAGSSIDWTVIKEELANAHATGLFEAQDRNKADAPAAVAS